MREDMQRKTNLSRVLYVDLLDPSGNVVKEIKLRIENGEADGYIDLDKLLVSGFYEIRAYTRYMLNWGSARMFSRVLPILNKPAKEGDYSDRFGLTEEDVVPKIQPTESFIKTISNMAKTKLGI